MYYSGGRILSEEYTPLPLAIWGNERSVGLGKSSPLQRMLESKERSSGGYFCDLIGGDNVTKTFNYTPEAGQQFKYWLRGVINTTRRYKGLEQTDALPLYNKDIENETEEDSSSEND